MSDRTFRQLLQFASQIAERASDSSGFVPLAALAREIHADVKFRPLLVEGVAAQPKTKDGRWMILIDSETHRVTDEMLALEDVSHPLGVRVRNTVAHELAHALGARCEAILAGKEKSRVEIVAALERETEQLSPALLISPRAMDAIVNASNNALDVDELVTARDRLGVSARVFVKRLELLSHETESAVRYHPRLDNLIIGSGEWVSAARAVLHPKPFRRVQELLPEFVIQLRNNKKVQIEEYFSTPDFYLNGGSSEKSEASLWMGTSAQPQSEKGLVEICVEAVPRKAEASFLWIARQRELERKQAV